MYTCACVRHAGTGAHDGHVGSAVTNTGTDRPLCLEKATRLIVFIHLLHTSFPNSDCPMMATLNSPLAWRHVFPELEQAGLEWRAAHASGVRDSNSSLRAWPWPAVRASDPFARAIKDGARESMMDAARLDSACMHIPKLYPIRRCGMGMASSHIWILDHPRVCV